MNLRSIGTRVGLGVAILAGTLFAGATFKAQTQYTPTCMDSRPRGKSGQ